MGAGIRIDFSRNDDEGNRDDNDDNSSGDRTITISGTQEQIQIVQQLMSQCVRSSEKLQQRNKSSLKADFKQAQDDTPSLLETDLEQGRQNDPYAAVEPPDQISRNLYVPWTQT